jgi:hypothetical protein
MLCVPCPFTAQFLFCSISAAALPSFFTHESPSTTTTATPTQQQQPHLFSVPCTYSFCAPCACNARNPLHAHTAFISSTSRVLCLIIMVTLQLLWRFSHAFNITGCHAEIPQPLWQLRLFVFSVLVELILSVFSYRLQSLFHLSIACINNPQSTGRCLETLHLLWRSHSVLFESSGRDHHLF